MPFHLKIIQFFQFKSLQSFYLLVLKCILWLMNYGIWWEENGEKKIIKLVDSFFNKADIKTPLVFDVWANIAQYLNDLNDNLTVRSRIYSFEPIPATFGILSSNKPVNSIHDIAVVNIGFGDRTEEMTIFTWHGNDDANSCASILESNISNFVSEETNKQAINITTIDEFCSSNGIDHINFLKIDIEWYELQCIKWAHSMINNGNIDIIQVEHNRCAIASRTFLRDYWDIFSQQYIVCRPLSWDKWLYEIEKYDIYLESFTYINYIFIKKDIFIKYFK